MTINLIKPGVLAQWKKDKKHWGAHWDNDSNIGLREHRKKLFDTEVYRDYVEESKKIVLLRNKEEKELEKKNLPEKENDKELMNIFMRYSSKIKDLELERQVFNFQYCFLILDGKCREWKIGNTIMNKKIFWKGMLTRRNNTTSVIWVDQNDIEPYTEGSYELHQQLLKKHNQRINKNFNI